MSTVELIVLKNHVYLFNRQLKLLRIPWFKNDIVPTYK